MVFHLYLTVGNIWKLFLFFLKKFGTLENRQSQTPTIKDTFAKMLVRPQHSAKVACTWSSVNQDCILLVSNQIMSLETLVLIGMILTHHKSMN